MKFGPNSWFLTLDSIFLKKIHIHLILSFSWKIVEIKYFAVGNIYFWKIRMFCNLKIRAGHSVSFEPNRTTYEITHVVQIIKTEPFMFSSVFNLLRKKNHKYNRKLRRKAKTLGTSRCFCRREVSAAGREG